MSSYQIFVLCLRLALNMKFNFLKTLFTSIDIEDIELNLFFNRGTLFKIHTSTK